MLNNLSSHSKDKAYNHCLRKVSEPTPSPLSSVDLSEHTERQTKSQPVTLVFGNYYLKEKNIKKNTFISTRHKTNWS